MEKLRFKWMIRRVQRYSTKVSRIPVSFTFQKPSGTMTWFLTDTVISDICLDVSRVKKELKY
jgi:hypothetical protein